MSDPFDDHFDSCDSGLSADHGIDVMVTDNPVVGVILGPDGSVLAEIYERPTTFGFARWKGAE